MASPLDFLRHPHPAVWMLPSCGSTTLPDALPGRRPAGLWPAIEHAFWSLCRWTQLRTVSATDVASRDGSDAAAGRTRVGAEG